MNFEKELSLSKPLLYSTQLPVLRATHYIWEIKYQLAFKNQQQSGLIFSGITWKILFTGALILQ